jgi:hypothetical protein
VPYHSGVYPALRVYKHTPLPLSTVQHPSRHSPSSHLSVNPLLISIIAMSFTANNAPTSTPRRLLETPINTARRLLGRSQSQAHISPAAATPIFRGSSSSSQHIRAPQGAASLDHIIRTSSPARIGLPYPSIPMEPAVGAGPPLLPSEVIGTGKPYSYNFRYSPCPAPSTAGDPQSPGSNNNSGSSVSGAASNAPASHHGADQSAFSPGTRAQVVSGKRK